MMRKTFFGLSIAALALAGCSQNELTGDQQSPLNLGNRAISFGSYVARPTSRAAGLTGIADFQNGGNFKAWAYVTTLNGVSALLKEADKIEPHTTLFGGSALDGTDLFAYDDTTDPSKPIWASAGKSYYWPDAGLGNVTFYALSSKTGASSENFTLTSPTKDTGASFSYTVGAEDKQEDLIAAQMYDKAWENADASKVILDFKHLLTQVRFTVKSSGNDLRIKVLKLAITGATNQGTFTFDIDNGGIGSWAIPTTGASTTDYTYFDATTGGGQETDFTLGFPKDDAVDVSKHFIGTTAMDFPLFGAYTADATPVPDAKQALIVLPSVAKDVDDNPLGLQKVKIAITYQCYILATESSDPAEVASWVTDGTSISRTIELTKETMWNMSKKVCYNLTLFNSTSGKITYKTDVSTWADEGSDSNLKPVTPVAPAP